MKRVHQFFRDITHQDYKALMVEAMILEILLLIVIVIQGF